MVSLRSSCILILALALTLSSQARIPAPLPESERDAYTEAFEKKQGKTRTFQADFTQTLKLRGVNAPLVGKGKIYYQAPDSLLIRFHQPADEWTLIRGSDFYLKKNSKRLVHRRLEQKKDSSHHAMQSLMGLFQNGAADLRPIFEIQMLKGKNQLTVTLKPKQGDEETGVVEIENRLSLPALEIQSVHVHFDETNSVLYEFSNPIRNRSLDESLFQIPDTDS